MSDQSTQNQNSSNTSSNAKYGADWVPSPDDPNYEAYLKYQQNLDAATQGHPVTAHGNVPADPASPGAAQDDAAGAGAATDAGASGNGVADSQDPSSSQQVPGASSGDAEWQRPKQENPDAQASDHIGPFYKPSHWSDKPNPDAPWWANPYTYVDKGKWREPNWGDGTSDQNASQNSSAQNGQEVQGQSSAQQGVQTGAASGTQQDAAASPSAQTGSNAGEPVGNSPSNDEKRAADRFAASQSAGSAQSGQPSANTQASNPFPGQVGAWVPTGDFSNPWNWDAEAIPNQAIDGKPCKVPAGAWVPSGNPASPWAWNAEVLPNAYQEGKPVFIPAQPGTPQAGQAQNAAGANPLPFGGMRDLSKESGEDRPDVPMGTRVGWFFIGLIGGFIGLLFAWMVASRYPQKQRKQVVWACWAGFFA
ncbi:MAG: hypothetical protein Q4A43_05715, partial [Coriobacteriia bacterium]|nr:hypothetical protein [Coriobacteriia bacterium]